MFTKLFWKDTVERAVKTFAQTVIAIVGVTIPATDMSLLDINYPPVLLIGVVAALLSVLSSIASSATSGEDTASLVTVAKKV